MWNRGNILDQLDGNASRLEGGDSAFASRPRTFDSDFDFFNTILCGLFGCLLGSNLTGKRRTLATSFEAARSAASPAQGIAAIISNRYRRVVKRRLDVRDSRSHVASNFSTLVRSVAAIIVTTS